MRSAPVFEVLTGGLLTTVQDIRPRARFGQFGVAAGGALDARSAALANRLAGNADEAALLEITLAGPVLRLLRAAILGLAGADLGMTVDGRPVSPGWSVAAQRGATVAFGERRRGARAYLAVAGGLDVPVVLGSRSTDLAGGFGGLGGRGLQAGDTLAAFLIPDPPARAGRAAEHDLGLEEAVRVVPGPHRRRFPPDALARLVGAEWRLAPESNRMGARLEGPAIAPRRADVPSLGLPLGAIQVPGDGQPIVLLADHQPTGGYPVLAVVIRADLPLLAQRAPGDPVRFALTTLEEARRAARSLPPVESDDFGWELARSAGKLT
ncbi:MAG: biotin-dependent carboxyltransferase family protein [Chloroflexota bacterium]|nr:biotin-dependent carboxyltransferase family protein [Dehalococcoidia bacterium]MDW8252289.1 biotin-dependent carboxyltransferase family protein [Chloroflexota bacterium]